VVQKDSVRGGDTVPVWGVTYLGGNIKEYLNIGMRNINYQFKAAMEAKYVWFACMLGICCACFIYMKW